jgi:hypothetical protein
VQVAISQWPSGLCREIASIKQASIEQALYLNLKFERDFDDLDYYSAAVFRIDELIFALQRYDGIPGGAYTLIVMNEPVDDSASLTKFLVWSGLTEDAVSWRLIDHSS